MQRFVLLVSFVFLTLTGCMHWFWFMGVSSPPATAEETVSPGGAVSDYDSFVDSLTAAGATVERRGIRFDHACWFSVPAKRIRVNREDMHVFGYDNSQAADADAALIAPMEALSTPARSRGWRHHTFSGRSG